MGPKEEPGILALLLAFAAALYAVTWLIAGPPGDREIPADVPIAAIKVALATHQLGPEPLLRSY